MVSRGFDVETSSEFRRKLSHKNAIKLEFDQEEVSFLERLLSADQLPVSFFYFFPRISENFGENGLDLVYRLICVAFGVLL